MAESDNLLTKLQDLLVYLIPQLNKFPLTILAILLPAFTLLASETATISDLAGQWHGKSRFTGISYAEATQKKVAAQNVEIVLHISPDGSVTGQAGGAELTNCVVEVNRGWFARLLHIKDDFIIRGQIIGAVRPGSERGSNAINAPFNLAEGHFKPIFPILTLQAEVIDL